MEFYQIAYRYLRLCKISVSQAFLLQRMRSHPDYPSMVSLVDTLDEINVKYQAVVVDKENYRELAHPFQKEFTMALSIWVADKYSTN